MALIVHTPFPRYMAVTAAVGAVGLVASVGTLAESFEPIFGPGWSLLVAALIDVLALSLTYWAVAAVRAGLPPAGPRLAAHACILASVAAQAVTGYQGLAGGMSGWTSAAAHCIGPAVLALALELIARHFIAEHRALLAPARAQEVLRVQIARAAAGLPVRLDECADAVVEAARADVVDIRALAATISADEVRAAPAMRALVTAVWPTTDLLPQPGPGTAEVQAPGTPEDTTQVQPQVQAEDARQVQARPRSVPSPARTRVQATPRTRTDEDVLAELREMGPLSVREAAALLGIGKDRARRLLGAREAAQAS